jgi:hypothetical protein
VKVLGAVLLTLGLEYVVLGIASYMAELWARHKIPGDVETPPRTLVTLAEFIRTLTNASPLVALTVLGIILIALGLVLRRQGAEGAQA